MFSIKYDSSTLAALSAVLCLPGTWPSCIKPGRKEEEEEVMENKNYFGNYTLQQASLDKLKEIDSLLDHDLCPADPAWSIIKPKEIKLQSEDEETPTRIEVPENNEGFKDQGAPMPSTQFFFSQRETQEKCNSSDFIAPAELRWSDIAESLYESLENTNETLALLNLKNLSDTEIDCVIEYLSNKLSLKGTYNFCHSVCAMDVDQSMIYIRIICKHLLLQKIIDLKEPSRLMSSVIQELVQKFPEDIQEFLYIPLLNAELSDTTVISVMINSFDAQRKNDLIIHFFTTVHKLKQWHVNILAQLINGKITENSQKEKLLNLLTEKASSYSSDKNYGKFIVSFVKLNAPFTEQQKNSLHEIISVNETIFKRVTENLLTNMYFYGDLWHIS